MILFEKDWYKYPMAIADFTTTNKTFIRFSALLKSMNIRNHTFMLALHDPSLQGIDPHSNDLTEKLKLKIMIECKINPWYFFREVAKAPPSVGNEPDVFKANRGNIALIWSYFNHITTILIQPRQTGKTYSIGTLIGYLLNIRMTNTQLNTLTQNDRTRVDNVRKIKMNLSYIPEWMDLRTSKDSNNLESITIKALNNEFNVHVSSQSPKQAEKVGRGLTSPSLWVDEAAYINNLRSALAGALPTCIAAMDKARELEEPYGIIYSTTAGKKDDLDGMEMHRRLTNAAIWSEVYYDCENRDELLKVLSKQAQVESIDGKSVSVSSVNLTFSHRQLGYTDEWLREQLAILDLPKEEIERDLLNRWTSGTQDHPLAIDILEKIRNGEYTDFYLQLSKPYGYATRWFCKEHEIESKLQETHYILTLDSSNAIGLDDLGLHIIDIRDGSILASGNYNETNLIQFSQWLADHWFLKYPNIIGMIENRSSGTAIIDFLINIFLTKDIDPYKRLFNRIVNDFKEDPDRFSEIDKPMSRRSTSVYDSRNFKSKFGFATSGAGLTSRNSLYVDVLQQAAKNSGKYIRDGKTINQLLGLTIRNNRIDHRSGDHDDLVISWLLGQWLLIKGSNLSFYGINPKEVLSQQVINKELMQRDPEEAYKRYEQISLRKNIEELVEKMMITNDKILLERYERLLYQMVDKLELKDDEKFSLDDFKKALEDEQKLGYYKTRSKSNIKPNIALTHSHRTISF